MGGNQWDWIVPGQVLASRYPSTRAELGALRDLGVNVIVNLTESPHPAGVLTDLGLTEIHLPIPDFTAPGPALLEQATETITHALDRAQTVAVHCQGGLGRTGTVVAAWLVTKGIPPDAAVARIREIRPGSIETVAQEEAVHDVARQIAARQRRPGTP
jgi:atypical dual specificity phosphatase